MTDAATGPHEGTVLLPGSMEADPVELLTAFIVFLIAVAIFRRTNR